ncbi:MAG: hypothetical protein HW387_1221 [Parachlamydiales bacterium]|nr:hypothetical protein [Parachlamydiales bacterium]
MSVAPARNGPPQREANPAQHANHASDDSLTERIDAVMKVSLQFLAENARVSQENRIITSVVYSQKQEIKQLHDTNEALRKGHKNNAIISFIFGVITALGIVLSYVILR